MCMCFKGMDLNGFLDDFALYELWLECLVICYIDIQTFF